MKTKLDLRTLTTALRILRQQPSALHVTLASDCFGHHDLRCIRIKPGSPKNQNDRLLLEAARASATIILTSGAILREEPRMTTQFDRNRFAKEFDISHPTTMILTRSAKIPESHIAYLKAPGAVKVCFVGRKHSPILQGKLHNQGVKLIFKSSKTTVTEIVSELKQSGERITIEGGPSITSPLYQTDSIDAVLLSIFHGEIEEKFIGSTTVPFDILESHFSKVWYFEQLEDKKNPWSFNLYVKNKLADLIAKSQNI